MKELRRSGPRDGRSRRGSACTSRGPWSAPGHAPRPGAHSAAALDRLRLELEASGTPTLALSADLSESASLEPLIAASDEAFGGVDVLVNNAGVWQPVDYTRADLDQIEGVIDLNLRADALEPPGAPRDNPAGTRPRGGAFRGSLGGAPYAQYSATKHALVGARGAFG